MKLSISNIAWNKENDEEMYEYISSQWFQGLEIAPTRVILENPYSHIEEAKQFAKDLYEKYHLEIPSMQSIWYGKQEKVFGTEDERKELIDYTKKAIDFASEIGCKNLVFGCPKNRNINDEENDYHIAIQFFRTIGEYAKEKQVVFAIEPNPTIYNTNFINTTKQAIDIVKDIDCPAVQVNCDLGTILQNNEDISILQDNINLIHHIHISEPNLEKIQKRELHKDLMSLLKEKEYHNYVSIEMKNQNDIGAVKEVMQYVRHIL